MRNMLRMFERTTPMREAAFIQRNKERWERLERAGEQLQGLSPDEASAHYVQITDDLSYARTFYPNSNVQVYLNGLAGTMHRQIYRNKPQDRGRFKRFWFEEVPLAMAATRKQLFASALIFALACLVGAVSAAHDDTFVRLILGDVYVEQTLRNIADGKPMAIYGSSPRDEMFLGITWNNIRVSFLAFGAGLLAGFGTGYILLYNGIMLGSFQYFFHEQGLLLESALSIWVHGTIEISAIVVAGAAGLVLGKGMLFPGTYDRAVSFRMHAKVGLKVVMGLVPFFILAGFLEAYVTRHAGDLHPLIPATIIALSLALVIYYFIVLPYHVERRSHQTPPGS